MKTALPELQSAPGIAGVSAGPEVAPVAQAVTGPQVEVQPRDFREMILGLILILALLFAEGVVVVSFLDRLAYPGVEQPTTSLWVRSYHEY